MADDYPNAVRADISNCLSEMSGQPILFLGSGVSHRYFNAPDWEGLLTKLAEACPAVPKDYAYYKQAGHAEPEIGTIFAKYYLDWAWADGKNEFPPEYFQPDQPGSIFIKHRAAEFLKSITPTDLTLQIGPAYAQELSSLQGIRPHAIVTTNYDSFVESLFPEYEPVIGQKVLKKSNALYGEIFKIHGCVSDPKSLVLTKDDYSDFSRKAKYLSAKLLAFFLEHPILFVGYRAADPNIASILSDIDIILSSEGALIPNIFRLQRTCARTESPPRDELIPVEENRQVRIRTIVTDDFKWVFDAFQAKGPIDTIRPRELRGLLARTYDLVRHDIPKRALQVDYTVLEQFVSQQDRAASILGITVVGDSTHFNAQFPFSLTQVAKQLGHERWHPAGKLLEEIHRVTGHDIKASDNIYHVAIKAGEKTPVHKYSHRAVELLKKAQIEGPEKLRLELPPIPNPG